MAARGPVLVDGAEDDPVALRTRIETIVRARGLGLGDIAHAPRAFSTRHPALSAVGAYHPLQEPPEAGALRRAERIGHRQERLLDLRVYALSEPHPL
jgi:hypothetical protein